MAQKKRKIKDTIAFQIIVGIILTIFAFQITNYINLTFFANKPLEAVLTTGTILTLLILFGLLNFRRIANKFA